jgi:hypothetical protein
MRYAGEFGVAVMVEANCAPPVSVTGAHPA